MHYAKALSDAIDEAPVATGLSRPEIEQQLVAISEQLKRPVGDAERILLCANRT